MWKLILVLLAAILYISYNVIVLALFGVPYSLSQTYYLFKEYKDKLRFMFPLMMIGIAILLLPAWIELSIGSPFQFTVFLACVGLIYTGMVPAFRNGNFENIVHTTSAYLAVVMSFIWIIALTNFWYIILIWGGIVGILGLIFKVWRSSYTYLLESIAIFASLTTIILYAIKML